MHRKGKKNTTDVQCRTNKSVLTKEKEANLQYMSLKSQKGKQNKQK